MSDRNSGFGDFVFWSNIFLLHEEMECGESKETGDVGDIQLSELNGGGVEVKPSGCIFAGVYIFIFLFLIILAVAAISQ